MNPIVKFRKLHPHAILPAYQTAGAAGMDLHWCPPEGDESASIGIFPVPFETGLAVEIPPGYEGQIRIRSSLGKLGFIIPNAPATIDSDFRGHLMVLLVALSPAAKSHIVVRGDRIAQLIIAPVARATIVEAEELSETARGGGGFGSTGR